MGCLRPWVPRLIYALTFLILGVVVWSSTRYPEAMWAPGHLSRHHTDITDCQSCHEPFRGTPAGKCLGCHTRQQFQNAEATEVGHQHLEIIQQEQACVECHIEHQGALTLITVGGEENPHGEFIFRSTGAGSCSACHRVNFEKGTLTSGLLENTLVQHLREEGEGAHRPGHFAKCLNCHRGGQMEIEDDE